MTITIPDWIFDGGFWAGVLTSSFIFGFLVFYAMRNFNPFGR